MQTNPTLDNESATDRVVRKTPWWGISVGLHLTLALVLGWIVVLQRPAESKDGIVIPPPKKPRDPVVFERQKDVQPMPVEVPVEKPLDIPVVNPNSDNPEVEDDLFNGITGNPDQASLIDLKSKNARDVIGAGATAPGRRGKGLDGRKNRRPDGKSGTPTKDTEECVERGLLWLARHQDPRGLWSVDGYPKQCAADVCSNPKTVDARFDTGSTGLALLAFLGAGYSHQSHDVRGGISFGLVVKRGLEWLLAQQREDGQIGDGNVYNHALATLALTEAYGLTGSILVQDPARRAIDWLAAAQNPGKGWRYIARSGDNDTSVTGWCVMAFKSAHLSGFRFPESVFEGARAWLDESSETNYHRTNYAGQWGKTNCAHNESFDHHESMTAIAAMSRIFMDRDPNDRRVAGAAAVLMRDLPKWEKGAIDYYYWYYGSLALFQVGGERFDTWNQALTAALVKNQNLASSGCRTGSWEPVDRWSCEAGRVYATAINVLTLEVYYRYPSAFGSR